MQHNSPRIDLDLMAAQPVFWEEELRRIQWKAWYCVARLLRWVGCRDLARGAALRGPQQR